jgi:indole-3-glycerol phosphate synthase
MSIRIITDISASTIHKLQGKPCKHEKAIINNYLLYSLTINHNPDQKRRHFILEVKHESSEDSVKDTKTNLEAMRDIKNYHGKIISINIYP